MTENRIFIKVPLLNLRQIWSGNWVFVLLLTLFLVLPAAAYDVIPTSDYQFPAGGNFPAMLKVNETIECGNYAFRLTYQPLISKSMHSIIGDYDLRYLTLRVAITNNGEETIGWISPDSFKLQEIYRNRIYGTYLLDSLMSAKAAAGFSTKAFYAPIQPGATLQTALVFAVFPEAEGWIFTLSPYTFGEEADETVQFLLPAAIIQ